MTFDQYLSAAWAKHANDSVSVADSFQKEGFALITKDDHIPLMANIVTHVMGEHLGRWSDGVVLLKSMREFSFFNKNNISAAALNRSIASLELSSGHLAALDGQSPSDQIRILAVSASALSQHGHIKKAEEFFNRAIGLASAGIEKADPANKALAITANNLASTFEEKNDRTQEETTFMIISAQTTRKFWAIAGGWLEAERAEYRLAYSYLKAGQLENAIEHAQKCIRICNENKATAFELFFGSEVMARIEHELKNQDGFKLAKNQAATYFSQVAADEINWCEPAMNTLNELSLSI